MRHIIRILIGILLLVIAKCSYSRDVIYLDIKTPLPEKNNLFAVKAGALHFIQQAEDFASREIGEDYSVWLLNYASKEKDGRIIIEFDIELRSPAMIRKGRLLGKEHVKVMYFTSEPISGENVVDFQSLKEKLREKGFELVYEAYYCGRETVEIIKELLDMI